ncbi:hypothetical protein HK098_007395 [Nowakowskiella sp. JEL0407]|nr:hypothetical protein HK098_007395 [Nowakowskiella sp. JEL0407]
MNKTVNSPFVSPPRELSLLDKDRAEQRNEVYSPIDNSHTAKSENLNFRQKLKFVLPANLASGEVNSVSCSTKVNTKTENVEDDDTLFVESFGSLSLKPTPLDPSDYRSEHFVDDLILDSFGTLKIDSEDSKQIPIVINDENNGERFVEVESPDPLSKNPSEDAEKVKDSTEFNPSELFESVDTNYTPDSPERLLIPIRSKSAFVLDSESDSDTTESESGTAETLQNEDTSSSASLNDQKQNTDLSFFIPVKNRVRITAKSSFIVSESDSEDEIFIPSSNFMTKTTSVYVIEDSDSDFEIASKNKDDGKTPNGDVYEFEMDDYGFESALLIYDGPPPKPKSTPKPRTPRNNNLVPTPTSNRRADVLTSINRKFTIKIREELSKILYIEYNQRIFGSKLPTDMVITWSNKLSSTAGRTHTKKQIMNGEITYSSWVELSTKVIDCEERLKSTLIHELCHVASWIIDQTNSPPHGDVFKKWGNAAMKVFKDITVSTCHNYEISYKYWYYCTNTDCGAKYGRHSKSIDIDTKVCGKCSSRLELPERVKKDGTPIKQNGWQVFVKENLEKTKEKYPGIPFKEMMKILSEEWKAQKA